jgi:hypothetical protein
MGDLIAQNRTGAHSKRLGAHRLAVRKPKSWLKAIDLHPKALRDNIATIIYLGMGHPARIVHLFLTFPCRCR